MKKKIIGNSIQTEYGQFDPFDYTPDQINIFDIAHSLSHICRYNGHCCRFYSVAEHSLNCATIPTDEFLGKFFQITSVNNINDENANNKQQQENNQCCSEILRKTRLALLLHDAAEAYIGDITRPIKKSIKTSTPIIENTENSLGSDIFAKYGISEYWNHPVIHAVDNAMLFTEKRDLKNTYEEYDWNYNVEPFSTRIPNYNSLSYVGEDMKHRFLYAVAHYSKDKTLKSTLDNHIKILSSNTNFIDQFYK